jgi:hypothetical protein
VQIGHRERRRQSTFTPSRYKTGSCEGQRENAF